MVAGRAPAAHHPKQEFYDALRRRDGVDCLVATAPYCGEAAGEAVGEGRAGAPGDGNEAPLLVEAASGAREELVGFVSWRLMAESDLDTGLLAADSCGAPVGRRAGAYVLTLGSVRRWQRKGLANELLRRCEARARASRRCRCVYLHVAAFNDAALQLYKGRSFQVQRKLADFYVIGQKLHDAYCLVKYVNGGHGALSAMAPHRALAALAGDALRHVGGALRLLARLGGGRNEEDGEAEIVPAALAMAGWHKADAPAAHQEYGSDHMVDEARRLRGGGTPPPSGII